MKLVSFKVKCLFTNTPLKDTIEILLRSMYIDKEISTSFTRTYSSTQSARDLK